MTTPRSDGCTLAGALSVAAAVADGLTVIHGPAGCAHHHVSLLLTTLLDRPESRMPCLLSDDLGEEEVIFGGEAALARALDEAVARSPGSIAVLSTCVAEAIGDDCRAVASRVPGTIPVVVIPVGGFFGGGFLEGERAALHAYGRLASRLFDPGRGDDEPVVVLVGEKNLEFEADAHADELGRLLGHLDQAVGLRFVREAPTAALGRLPGADLLVLREPALGPVADRLPVLPGTPRIDAFPVGLSATVGFLSAVGAALGLDADAACEAELDHQETVLARFAGLAGSRVRLPAGNRWLAELAEALGLVVDPAGVPLPVPDPAPVGTAGIARLLSRWRRAL
ncbi:MAG TPA: nitrogenase component 1 [Methanoregulaceae archaeon]|nr:nitrogenase component 1 [Methanoregulaceae archaeon]